MTVQDVGQNGQVLLVRSDNTAGVRGRMSPVDEERELTLYDWSPVVDMSADGRSLLFDAQRIGGRSGNTAYVRGMDGSPPVRLGDGMARSLSPDGKWALVLRGSPHRLVLLPTGVGDSIAVPRGKIDRYNGTGWLPDGKSIVVDASEPGHEHCTYIQDLAGGLPRPITPEGIAGTAVSPDGRFVAAVSPDGRLYVCPTNGASPRLVTELHGEDPVHWTPDGRALVTVRLTGARASLSRVELGTGRTVPWRTYSMPDSAGAFLGGIVLSPNAPSYAYTYFRFLQVMYLVDGLK